MMILKTILFFSIVRNRQYQLIKEVLTLKNMDTHLLKKRRKLIKTENQTLLRSKFSNIRMFLLVTNFLHKLVKKIILNLNSKPLIMLKQVKWQKYLINVLIINTLVLPKRSIVFILKMMLLNIPLLNILNSTN